MMSKITIDEIERIEKAFRKNPPRESKEMAIFELEQPQTESLTEYKEAVIHAERLIFEGATDKKLIPPLLKVLLYSKKALRETSCNQESDLTNIFYTHKKYSDSKDGEISELINEKKKGGRAGREYKEYEALIIKTINKYNDTPRGDGYTKEKAIGDLERHINNESGKEFSIHTSSFDRWRVALKETKGKSIYR